MAIKSNVSDSDHHCSDILILWTLHQQQTNKRNRGEETSVVNSHSSGGGDWDHMFFYCQAEKTNWIEKKYNSVDI